MATAERSRARYLSSPNNSAAIAAALKAVKIARMSPFSPLSQLATKRLPKVRARRRSAPVQWINSWSRKSYQFCTALAVPKNHARLGMVIECNECCLSFRPPQVSEHPAIFALQLPIVPTVSAGLRHGNRRT
jgi:hypothetical protein